MENISLYEKWAVTVIDPLSQQAVRQLQIVIKRQQKEGI